MTVPVNLHGLALHTRLPREWLRREALAGRLPCLMVGRKLLFCPDAVVRAITERAAVERQEATRAS